jgi:hypothetical protein
VTVGADNFGVFTWHQIYSKFVLHHDEDRTIDLSVLSHKRLLESQELHLATGKIHATGSRLLGDFPGRLLVFDMARVARYGIPKSIHLSAPQSLNDDHFTPMKLQDLLGIE